MTRHSRKSKKRINKRPKSISVVSPPNKAVARTQLPPGVAKVDPHRSVITSKEILIAAPIDFCFGMIASQLEQPCQWDTILFSVWPVSEARGQTGATSQVILNLGGRKVDSQAMISHYSPYRSGLPTGSPR